MKPLLLTLLVCLLTAGSGARADRTEDELDLLVVTATRSSISRDEALVPLVVIDRDEIERSGALDLAELLQFHAGIEIARNGGPGTVATVFLRGTDSNHTLVMIDGVPINPGTIGGAAVQNLSPEIIERVEIVKGPRSSLYGTEAVGGVINVITRRPARLVTFAADAGAGRYSTRDLSASAAVQGAGGELALTAAQFETDGFPARIESELDRAYRNTSWSLRGNLRVGGLRAQLRHWQASGESEYLGFLLEPLDQAFENSATALALSWGELDGWHGSVQASRIVDEIEQNQSADFAKTERDVLDWQNDLALRSHRLVTGVTLTREETSALSFGLPLDEGDGSGRVETDTVELYAVDDFDIGDHNLLIAARHTDHESFGRHSTWNVEYGYALGRTRLTAGAGTAFRAPDSSDRFGFGGRPDLEPETSTSLELGLRHRLGPDQELRAQLYHTEIDDLIEFVILDPLTFVGENRNIKRARIRGIEASYHLERDPWEFRVSAVAQNPEDRDTGARLLRRARRSLTANLVRRVGRHEIGLKLLANGDREDFGFPAPTPLGSYLLANLTGALRLDERWTLRGKVENVLDEDYATAAGFRSAERSLFISVGYATE